MELKKMIGMALISALSLGVLTGCGGSATANEASTQTPASNTAAAGNAGDDTTAAQELRTIHVGYMTGMPDQWAGFIGTEEGIFEKYGIVIDSSEYAAGVNTVDAIANGVADTGLLADYAAANRIGNTLGATNLRIFTELSLNEPNNGGLYVAPQYADDLKSLDGSEGWLTQIGTVWEYYNWQAQTYIGIDPDAQNVVQTDSNQTSLALAQQGDASAIIVHGANARYFEEQGWVLGASSKDMGIKTGIYLITTTDYIDANADTLADYLTALNESIEYISANVDTVAPRVEAKFGISVEDFTSTWNSYNFEVGFTEEGATHLEEVTAWAYEHGKFDTEYNIREYIDTSIAEKAVPDQVTINK